MIIHLPFVRIPKFCRYSMFIIKNGYLLLCLWNWKYLILDVSSIYTSKCNHIYGTWCLCLDVTCTYCLKVWMKSCLLLEKEKICAYPSNNFLVDRYWHATCVEVNHENIKQKRMISKNIKGSRRTLFNCSQFVANHLFIVNRFSISLVDLILRFMALNTLYVNKIFLIVTLALLYVWLVILNNFINCFIWLPFFNFMITYKTFYTRVYSRSIIETYTNTGYQHNMNLIYFYEIRIYSVTYMMKTF